MKELTVDIQARTGQAPERAKASRISFSTVEAGVALVAIVAGFVAAFRLLSRGVFFDEYFTLAMTNPGQSVQQFVDVLKLDAHPALHFLVIWMMRLLGLEDIAALRAANLLGVPVLIWGLWFSVRHNTLTRTQAWTIAALCASSAIFLDGFAETRSYFMQACASTTLVLSWRVVARRIETGGTLDAGLLTAWGLPLAMLSNLHYFGMILGGLMTATLLYDLLRAKRMRDLIIVALVSALAAAPALILVAMQMGHQPAHFWIETTPEHSLEIYIQFMRGVIVNNLAVFAFAVAAVFQVTASRTERNEARTTLILAMTVVAFFSLLFVINILKPVIIPRYLTPAIGPIIVVSALLALGKNATKWTSVAISVCALLAVAEAIATKKHFRDGWDVSAAKVAGIVAACPDTKVFVESHRGDSKDDVLDNTGRAAGYAYWKARDHLPITEILPGSTIPAGDKCPNLFWAEHTFVEQAQGLDVNGMLKRHGLTAAGPTSLEYVSSGAIITVGKAQ